MYLELSPRHTGKTTRIIQSVKENINNTRSHIIIQILNYNMLNIIKKNFNCSELDRITFITNKLELKGYSDYKFYCDEFDIYEKDKVFITPNGWYSSTPIRKRTKKDIKDFILGKSDDILLQLIALNNGIIQCKFSFHAYLQGVNKNNSDVELTWFLVRY